MSSTIDVYRGDLVESRHEVAIAVVRSDGSMVASSGDPELVAFWRSCAKPFQAIPSLVDGAAVRFGFGSDALALACASHNGEERHAELARRMLAAAGAKEDDLVCGPHASINDDVATAMTARGAKPGKAHNNCSGKHANMIAEALHRSWGAAGYADPAHPLQRRCLAEVACWTDLTAAEVPHATDGCGVPSFALPLREMALAWARLGAAAEGDELPGIPKESRDAGAALFTAMREHPFLIAGTGRLDTELIEATRGRIVPKVGAEGVYCAAIPEQRVGLALKIADGATRALSPALLGLLELLVPGLVPAFEVHRNPPIRNTLGATVGHHASRIDLRRDASR